MMEKIYSWIGFFVWWFFIGVFFALIIYSIFILCEAIFRKNWFCYYIKRNKYPNHVLRELYSFNGKSKRYCVKFRLRNIKNLSK